MEELARIQTFLKVVQTGSFSAAARDVSSISSVVRQVKSLEDEVGARLLNRSTRSLSLTEPGRRFYERATKIVTDLDNAKSEAKSLHDGVTGLLRVTARISAGTTTIVPALPRFLAQYPELGIDLTLTDERRDLIAHNIDVAIWLGHLPDSEIVARRLSPSQRVVCGSPAYFERHGVPRRPEDLREHNCLLFSAGSYGNTWGFGQGEQQQMITVSGNLCSDNGLVLLSAAEAGMGVVVVHDWMVRSVIAQGALVRVLEDYVVTPRAGDAELYAVYASSRGLPRKVRVFVDFLVDMFR